MKARLGRDRLQALGVCLMLHTGCVTMGTAGSEDDERRMAWEAGPGINGWMVETSDRRAAAELRALEDVGCRTEVMDGDALVACVAGTWCHIRRVGADAPVTCTGTNPDDKGGRYGQRR